MARARKNWAQVVLVAVSVIGPTISKLGNKKIAQFQAADREAQIKMVRRWAIVNPPLWFALRNKKVAGRVVDFLTSEEGKEIIAAGGEVAVGVAKAKLATSKLGQKTGKVKTGKVKTGKTAKKNSRARRNHHLVVGERVKLSDWGIKYLQQGKRFQAMHPAGLGPDSMAPPYLMESDFNVFAHRNMGSTRIGKVIKDLGQYSRRTGWWATDVPKGEYYAIEWDIEYGGSIAYLVPDKAVVAAESTSRKWPGDHYEGVWEPVRARRSGPGTMKKHRERKNPHRELDVGDVVKWSPSYLEENWEPLHPERYTAARIQDLKAEKKRQEKWRGTIVGLRMRSDPLWGYDVKAVNPHGLTYELQAKTEEVVPANPRGFRVKTSHHFDRAPKDNPMRKNPKARRNHHLIVGERVKLSDSGIRYARDYMHYTTDPAALRGTVKRVGANYYEVELDGERGMTRHIYDDELVSAESTTTKWPGNHYEGVDPMAKKNPRSEHFKGLAGLVRDYIDDHPGASFDEALTHAMAGCREVAEWAGPGDYNYRGFKEVYGPDWESVPGMVQDEVRRQFRTTRPPLSEAQMSRRARKNITEAELIERAMFDDRPPLNWEKKRRKPRKKARRNISEAALIDRAMFDDRPPLDWGDSPPTGRREVRGISTGKRRSGGRGGSKPSDYMFPEILKGNWRYKKVYDAVSAYLGGQRNYAKLTWFAQEAESKGKRLTNIGALVTMGLAPERAFEFLNYLASEFPSTTTTSEGKKRVVFASITPQIQAAARSKLGMFIGDMTANPRSRRNPQNEVYPGPWIGYPKYYEVASNAGPFTPEIFPFGQAGRPATYTVIPSEATQIKQLLPVKVVKNPAPQLPWLDHAGQVRLTHAINIYIGKMRGDRKQARVALVEAGYDEGTLERMDVYRHKQARKNPASWDSSGKPTHHGLHPLEYGQTVRASFLDIVPKDRWKAKKGKNGTWIVYSNDDMMYGGPYKVKAKTGREAIKKVLTEARGNPVLERPPKLRGKDDWSHGGWGKEVDRFGREIIWTPSGERHFRDPDDPTKAPSFIQGEHVEDIYSGKVGGFPENTLKRARSALIKLGYSEDELDNMDHERTIGRPHERKRRKLASVTKATWNPRYAIPLQHPAWEYDVWAEKPTQANWTTYPTYSYQQFYRTNPAKRNRRTLEGYIEHGSGPRGGLTPAERKSIPSHMFLEPKTRSFPVQDRNHAWIAVQYMTRFHIPNAPILIRRLAKFYPPSDPQNAKIWDRYKRLRKKIEEMSGKNMPTFSQLKGRKARKAAANRGWR